MKSLDLVINIAFRNLWRNPKRTVITFTAIAVGVMSAVFLSALARGLSTGMAENAIKTLTGHIQIHAKGYLDDPLAELSMEPLDVVGEANLSNRGVLQRSTRIRIPAVVMSERESLGVTVVGISPKEETNLSFVGSAISSGRMLSDESEPSLVVGEDLLRVLKSEVGRRLVLVSQNAENQVVDRGFRVIGTFKAELRSTERSYVFVGRKVAQEWLNLGDKISEVVLKIEDADLAPEVAKDLGFSFPNLDIKPWQELEPLVTALRKVQDGFLIIWFFIVILAVSFGVVNTQLMAIFERTREFGIIMALGLTPKQLIVIVGVEASLLLGIGVIVGNFLGGLCFLLFQNGIDLTNFAAASEHLGFSRIIYPHFLYRDWIICDVLLLLVGMVGSLYPAWLASRLNPVKAISGRE